MKDIPTKIITLGTGAEVTIPIQFEYSKCKGCGATDIIWATTKNGKYMPIRYDNEKRQWISHFSDCPKANNFRKPINNSNKGKL